MNKASNLPLLISGLLILPALLVGVGGCTKKTPSTASGASGVNGSGSDGKTKIVFIPKSAGNPYFAQVEAGFKRSAEGFGLDFSSQAPQSADATSQISVLKDQVQRGQQVIVISPNSPDALNETLDQITAKGIPVITADADLVGNETHRTLAVLPVDFATIGPSQVELLGEMIDYKGEIAILSATTDAPNQNAWIKSMQETLKESKYAGMKLVEIAYGDDEPQKSTTETEALLTKHPNLRGIIVPTSVGLASAAQVLSQKGVFQGGKNARGSGVVLTGLGTPNELRKAIANGVIQKFQLWDPADIGVVAGYLGTQLVKKKVEPKVGAKFEVPGKGSFEIKEKGIVIAGKLLTFDKANIDGYRF